MEVLLVVLAGRRYALPSARVEEVVPRTRLVPIDGAAAWVAGLMDYRGALIPVIDGARLIHDESSPSLLGSRIVVLDVLIQRGAESSVVTRFGLLCDLVTERTKIDLDDGAWRSGSLDDRPSIIGAIGRVGTRPMPLIDPLRIVGREPMLSLPAGHTTIDVPSLPPHAEPSS